MPAAASISHISCLLTVICIFCGAPNKLYNIDKKKLNLETHPKFDFDMFKGSVVLIMESMICTLKRAFR